MENGQNHAVEIQDDSVSPNINIEMDTEQHLLYRISDTPPVSLLLFFAIQVSKLPPNFKEGFIIPHRRRKDMTLVVSVRSFVPLFSSVRLFVVASKVNCADYWFKELQKSRDSCTGILIKTPYN